MKDTETVSEKIKAHGSSFCMGLIAAGVIFIPCLIYGENINDKIVQGKNEVIERCEGLLKTAENIIDDKAALKSETQDACLGYLSEFKTSCMASVNSMFGTATKAINDIKTLQAICGEKCKGVQLESFKDNNQ